MLQLLMFTAGICTGIFYFGGLYWTLCRIRQWKRAVPVTLFGFFLRVGVSLGAVYLFSSGKVDRMIWILLGFFSVRIMMTYIFMRRYKKA